jgi:hypothetical protein
MVDEEVTWIKGSIEKKKASRVRAEDRAARRMP